MVSGVSRSASVIFEAGVFAKIIEFCLSEL